MMSTAILIQNGAAEMNHHFPNHGLSLYSGFNLLNLRVTGPNASHPPAHTEVEAEGKDVTKLGHFKQKTQVDLKEVSPGEGEVKYKSNGRIVGKLAIFGDRVMRFKAKRVEEEFTKTLQEKLRDVG